MADEDDEHCARKASTRHGCNGHLHSFAMIHSRRKKSRGSCLKVWRSNLIHLAVFLLPGSSLAPLTAKQAVTKAFPNTALGVGNSRKGRL